MEGHAADPGLRAGRGFSTDAAAISFFKEKAPVIEMLGDIRLNVSNELTSLSFKIPCVGLKRIVPSCES